MKFHVISKSTLLLPSRNRLVSTYGESLSWKAGFGVKMEKIRFSRQEELNSEKHKIRKLILPRLKPRLTRINLVPVKSHHARGLAGYCWEEFAICHSMETASSLDTFMAAEPYEYFKAFKLLVQISCCTSQGLADN